MGMDTGEQRARMVRVLGLVEHYERNSVVGADLMRGVRYELAVQATEVNGDGCQFPACGCAKADCARRSPCVPRIAWQGPRTGRRAG